MKRIRPVILCGGSGTRLWPVSRASLPKQFAPLLGDRSTFQDTLLRVSYSDLFDTPLIVTSIQHQHLAERQMAEIGLRAEILLEPVRRDSGPAILAACSFIARNAAQDIALVLAADHLVKDPGAFREAVVRGRTAASCGRLVTFGISPTRPETEYGYIEPGGAVDDGARHVVRFAEKPDVETAARYVSAGYLWNSGNFLFAVDSLIGEYRRFSPATAAAVENAVKLSKHQASLVTLDEALFSQSERRSIDYAVFEQTARAAVVESDCGWSDIGTWDAVWAMGNHDIDGNLLEGDIELLDSRNCFVSTDKALTSVVGVENLVVVANRDAILVADRRRSAEVKALVESLRSKGRREADCHARQQHPWGWSEALNSGDEFKVTKILIYPNRGLALQRHDSVAVFLIVMSGISKVTIGEVSQLVGQNQHAYIPPRTHYSVENSGAGCLEIIEIQNQTCEQ